VAVLDIAFAAEGGGSSFERITLPFIRGLGSRLAAWVDHHDHDRHVDYAGDPRFVLSTKAEHGACPEMVTPELVRATGPVDTIAVHLDLDGLYSGAKWVLSGEEPYDLGSGYGHIALTVEDLDATLAGLADKGITPEREPYTVPSGARICFVADPDGYRIELIEGDFQTPQDPDR